MLQKQAKQCYWMCTTRPVCDIEKNLGDLEITAVKLKLTKKNIIVACVYRSPTGNMDYFLQHIEIILNSFQNAKTEIILCGDLNINFKENNNNKIRLEQLLNTFNLVGNY